MYARGTLEKSAVNPVNPSAERKKIREERKKIREAEKEDKRREN